MRAAEVRSAPRPCESCGTWTTNGRWCTRLHVDKYRVTVSLNIGAGSTVRTFEDREHAIATIAGELATLSVGERSEVMRWADALTLVRAAESDREPGGIGSALRVGDRGSVKVEHRRVAVTS